MVRSKLIDLPFSLYHVLSRINYGEISFYDSRGHRKGKARTVLICLLRERLTWTGREISEFLGIKRSIYCYFAKIREYDEIRKDYNRLKDVIFVRV